MMHGLDPGFLVAAEVTEHAEHTDARATLARLLGAGNRIAIAPQVLAEFIHIVTDPRRFTHPLDMGAARQLAEQWWTASDVIRVFPDRDKFRAAHGAYSRSKWRYRWYITSSTLYPLNPGLWKTRP